MKVWPADDFAWLMLISGLGLVVNLLALDCSIWDDWHNWQDATCSSSGAWDTDGSVDELHWQGSGYVGCLHCKKAD
jgi:hypothetical protein